MPPLFQRALVSVANDLATDNRVHRTCTVLQELGCDGCWWAASCPATPGSRSVTSIRTCDPGRALEHDFSTSTIIACAFRCTDSTPAFNQLLQSPSQPLHTLHMKPDPSHRSPIGFRRTALEFLTGQITTAAPCFPKRCGFFYGLTFNTGNMETAPPFHK